MGVAIRIDVPVLALADTTLSIAYEVGESFGRSTRRMVKMGVVLLVVVDDDDRGWQRTLCAALMG